MEIKRVPKQAIFSNVSAVRPMGLWQQFIPILTTSTVQMRLRKRNIRPRFSIQKRVDKQPLHL